MYCLNSDCDSEHKLIQISVPLLILEIQWKFKEIGNSSVLCSFKNKFEQTSQKFYYKDISQLWLVALDASS